jgi:mannose-6-phosphate isomerase-like protein (cupin superfamily)/GNAT superfamily N-acetyltransferase
LTSESPIRRNFVRGVDAQTETAPDGMRVSVLTRGERGSLARFELAADRVGHAVRHQTVDELWFVVDGEAELWTHTPDGTEQMRALGTDDSLLLEAGTCFQVRAGARGVSVLATTMPPWPGEDEALLVHGAWPANVPLAQSSRWVIERAQVDDCELLTGLALRAKAWWRYDNQFLERCADELRVRPTQVASAKVLVARGCHLDSPEYTSVLGFAGYEFGAEGVCDLTHLFVEPRYLNRGVGRALLTALAGELASLGVKRIEIQADPGAAPFYENLGAKQIGRSPSLSIPGRDLPLLHLRLANLYVG